LRHHIPLNPVIRAAILAAVICVAHPHVLRAQRINPPQRLAENTNPAITGQVTVRIQQDTGSPFTAPAIITLRSYDMTVDLTQTADSNGQFAFGNIPVGQYLLEVTSNGYNTVREHVAINVTGQAQDIPVVMIAEGALSRIPSAAVVPRNAIKETEKGLRALQIGKFDETQAHLTRALAYAPNFADGNYLMGVVLLRRKESAKALPYLQKAVDLAPTHAPAFLALGQAAYLQGDLARATESLQHSLREQPGGPQAAAAQELIARIRESSSSPAAPARGDGVNSSPELTSHKISVDTLRELAVIAPVTETNWLPPDVDQQKLVLDPGVTCQLDDVIHATGDRVKELVENVGRFTATENVEHYKLSPLGLQISHETRKFDYLVEIRPFGVHDLDVQEYRNGSVSAQQFPGRIGTNGLPTLALVFHPYYQEKYQYACEGRGVWRNKPAWLVHFQQRADRKGTMLVYRVGPNSYAVGLKGRAWIDAVTSQIVAIETDTMRPVPEIRLARDHQLIEYGPVAFRNDTMHLWLPKSADWYCSLSGQRYHRRHTFTQFLLFSVDDTQKIGKPKDPTADPPKDPIAQAPKDPTAPSHL
jgi:hypothetical protein